MSAKTSTTGTVYLLHFAEPYRHAKHYLGFTDNLQQRLAEHANGTGARLMAVIREAGIGFELARTWEGDRHLERHLKGSREDGGRHHKGSLARLCPVCRQARKSV